MNQKHRSCGSTRH
ncbi:MAG: hypothetical protein E6Q89_03010 [Bacteroidia bacterium]|nr:MAG: hypothetical protein E6Q89_03010 [Bacteroidia bacterium]